MTQPCFLQKKVCGHLQKDIKQGGPKVGIWVRLILTNLP